MELLGHPGMVVCPTDSIFPIMTSFDHWSVTYSQSVSHGAAVGQEGDQVTGWGRQATLSFSPHPQTKFLVKHLTALSFQRAK